MRSNADNFPIQLKNYTASIAKKESVGPDAGFGVASLLHLRWMTPHLRSPVHRADLVAVFAACCVCVRRNTGEVFIAHDDRLEKEERGSLLMPRQ